MDARKRTKNKLIKIFFLKKLLFSNAIDVRIVNEICPGIMNRIPKSLLFILEKTKIRGNVDTKIRIQNLISLFNIIFFLNNIRSVIPIN